MNMKLKLQNEQDYNFAMRITEQLMDSTNGFKFDLLSILSQLIEEYEAVHYPDTEYEFIVTDDSLFSYGTWLPLDLNRLKEPEKLQSYIDKGLIREKKL